MTMLFAAVYASAIGTPSGPSEAIWRLTIDPDLLAQAGGRHRPRDQSVV